MKIENLQAVIFDMGDTLIHGNFTAGATESVWEEIYSRLLNPDDSPDIPSLAEFRRAWLENVQAAMAQTWLEKPEQELDFLPLVQKAFHAAGMPQANDLDFIKQVVSLEHHLLYQQVVELAPEAITTLHALKKRGYRLGLVSNFCNLPEVAYSNIASIGLLECFDQTLLSCELGWRKPSRRIYAAICERLEVAPVECLFVGDRLVEDILGPQSFGMRTVLTTQFRQEEPTATVQPDAVITRLEELLSLV
ncbi:MAG TPA: HAD family hydrolase [Chloroflexia bacterium]|nr:HAD family hydrolase [Chloroflexia bacterium]